MQLARRLPFFLLWLLSAAIHPSLGVSQESLSSKLGLTRTAGSLPVWEQPDDRSLSELGRTVRHLQRSVLIVGCPSQGHGTAFVISREHRLLATNAHVADILHHAKKLTAVVNGETASFEVQKVWYHPGVVRYLGDSRSMIGRTQSPDLGSVCPLGPDVAVLQLATDGDDLPPAFDLATPDELKDLFAQPVGMLGFPGHDSSFPKPNEMPGATFHQGVISRTTDFQGMNAADDTRLQLIQHTAAGWGGFSGSPIFLPNGHVVALHNMGRNVTDRGATQRISHGVRIDCLWELLVYHQLDRLLTVPVPAETLNVERFDEPDPTWDKFVKVVQLIYESEMLRKQQKFAEAGQKCKEAQELAPDFLWIDCARMQIHTDYVASYVDRLSHQVIEEQLGHALKHAGAYAQKAPSDPRGVILYAHAYSNYAAAEYRLNQNDQALIAKRREAIELLTKVLQTPSLGDVLRAETLNYRAFSRMAIADVDGAFADYAEAIRLDPTVALFYTNRAQLYEHLGRNREARADLRRAQQLQQQATAEPVERGPTRGSTWVPFVSDEGRYRIEFPGTPKSSVNRKNTTLSYLTAYTDPQDEMQYLVNYTDLSADVMALNWPADRMLDKLRDNLLDDTMHLEREDDVRLGTHAGRELSIRLTSGERLQMRQYVVKDRFYQVAVGASAQRFAAERANVSRFLNSFTLSTRREPVTSSPRSDLYRFESGDGRFEASFPVRPRQQNSREGAYNRHHVQVHDEYDHVTMAMDYIDLDAAQQRQHATTEGRLALLRNEAVSNGRVVGEGPLEYRGTVVTELRVARPDGYEMVARLSVDGARVYRWFVEGPADAMRRKEQEAKRFLDSVVLHSGQPGDAISSVTPTPTSDPRTDPPPPSDDPPADPPPPVDDPFADPKDPVEMPTSPPAETPPEASQDWRKFTSYRGGFRAQFPGQPEASTKKGEFYDHQVHMAFDTERSMAFIVSYADFNEELLAKHPTSQKRLDFVRDRVVDDDRLRMERNMRLAGHRGRDLEIERPDDGVCFARLFIVEDRLYQIVVVGPDEDLAIAHPLVRRFIDSFALIPIVTDVGELKFEDIEARHGPLGPVRDSLDVLPYDPIDFAANLSGILTTHAGTIDFSWTMKVANADGQTVFRKEGKATDAGGMLSGKFPFSASLTLPDNPGTYTLTINATDNLSTQITSFTRQLTVKPAEFALVGLRFYRDKEGNAPSAAGGAAGQMLFAKLRAIGFDRTLNRIEVAMTVQLLDKDGKPVLPRSITAEGATDDAEIVKQSPYVEFDAQLPLQQAGDYTLRIVLHDKLGNNFTKHEVPIHVAKQ